MLYRSHKPHVTSLTQKRLLHLRLRWHLLLNSMSLVLSLSKNSMLLCYSFVQFIVRLFDDLNDDVEFHYVNSAPDIDVPQQTSTWSPRVDCRCAVTDVDSFTVLNNVQLKTRSMTSRSSNLIQIFGSKI